MEDIKGMEAPALPQQYSEHRTAEDKLIYACENGDDDSVSSLLQEGTPSLEKTDQLTTFFGAA